MKKSKSANHRFWYLENKDFMKKQNKKKSHKKKEDLKAEKQENMSEKSRRKNNIIDKNKDIEEITEDNYETSTVMEFITGNNFFNILTFKLTTYLSNFKSRDFFIQPSVLQNLLAQKNNFVFLYFFALPYQVPHLKDF